VDKKSDNYWIYTQADFFRNVAKKRAPSTESEGGGYSLSTDTYNCDIWALHKDIDDPTRANTDSPLDPDADATEWVTQGMLITREIEWCDTYFKTGVWGTSTTPSNLWSDYTNSDPIGDVSTGIRTVRNNTGIKPNTLVLGPDVWDKLKQHPDLVSRFKYTGATPVLTRQQVASVFELQNIYVGEATYNTTAEGATASYSTIFGKHAILLYVNPRPGIRKPSAGYIYGWKSYTGNPYGVKVSKIRAELLKSDRIEIEMAYDHKLVSSALGYAFISVVS